MDCRTEVRIKVINKGINETSAGKAALSSHLRIKHPETVAHPAIHTGPHMTPPPQGGQANPQSMPLFLFFLFIYLFQWHSTLKTKVKLEAAAIYKINM